MYLLQKIEIYPLKAAEPAIYCFWGIGSTAEQLSMLYFYLGNPLLAQKQTNYFSPRELPNPTLVLGNTHLISSNQRLIPRSIDNIVSKSL